MTTKLSESSSDNYNFSDSDLELPLFKYGESLSLSSDEWYKMGQSTWDKKVVKKKQTKNDQDVLDQKETIDQPHKIVGRIYNDKLGPRDSRPTWERHLSDSFSYDEDIKHTQLRLSKYGIDLEGELNEFSELKSKDFDPSGLSENEPNDSDLPQDPEKKANKFRLHTIYTAPLALGYFRHIERGYRVYFSVPLCFKTALTRWHNETINIATHFFGGLFFLIMLATLPFLDWFQKTKLFAKFSIMLFLLCTSICLFSSAIFHVLKCHSAALRKTVLKMDINGIIIQEMGVFVIFFYYGLKESQLWRTIHIIIYVSFGCLLSICYWTIPILFQNQNLRSVILTFSAVYGFGPIIQGSLSLDSDFRNELFIRIAIMYVFYGLGLFFFLSKVPERFTKNGYFDYIGASHQIWHLLVIAGPLWVFYSVYLFAKRFPDS
ncbi:progestin and adipoq receptor family member 3 [Anaeramoeba flamelloides]|uniref:Progestin and adipoq receptor family member 3 n=1 Tax=Anaeramoeba flamelloides TaxID=1746091 RepID=A0ABQ8Z5N5_9EUKA|nr:progestin and adipoq receptor family member 3 [Anaeramoeba flamelloides]